MKMGWQMENKDDVSAFPQHRCDADGTHATTEGMTLRQWYAGKAMQGYMAGWASSPPSGFVPKQVAQFCFQLADAMLGVDPDKCLCEFCSVHQALK